MPASEPTDQPDPGTPAPEGPAGQAPKAARWLGPAIGLLALVGLMGFGAMLLQAGQPGQSGLKALAVGQMRKIEWPQADMPLLPTRPVESDAGPVSLNSFGAKLLVVNLWASWCTPCLEEMPGLAKVAAAQDPARIKLVLVSVDKLSAKQEAREILGRLGKGLDWYWDSGLAFDMRARGLPTTVIYADGREVARLSGGADWTKPEVQTLLDALAAQASAP